MNDTIKLWSVREATTKGRVIEVEGRMSRDYFKPLDNNWAMWRLGIDVTRTREEAEALARVMVAKRKATLEKGLVKINKNPFAKDPTQ